MTSSEDLIRKSYRSVFIIWLTVMAWCLSLGKPWIALSVTLGTLVSTAALWSLEWVVRRSFTPGTQSPRRGLVILTVVKFLPIATLLYWLVRWERINLIAFVGGIVLVHFALLVKALSIRTFGRRGSNRDRGSTLGS